jgi:hypothetical protein
MSSIVVLKKVASACNLLRWHYCLIFAFRLCIGVLNGSRYSHQYCTAE